MLFRSLLATACALAAAIALPAAAPAAPLDDPVNQWLPSSEGATWDYEWFNSGYSPRRTRERYTVKAREGDIVPPGLDHRGPGQRRGHGARGGRDRLPPHRPRPGQHELGEHAAAVAVPRPVRERHAMPEQPLGLALHAHLGHPVAGPPRAARPEGALEVRSAARTATSRRQPLPRPPEGGPSGVPGGRHRRGGRDRTSPRRAPSATRSAAACARSGGSTAWAR